MPKPSPAQTQFATEAGNGPLSDGHPRDAVQYREYKILLRPDGFTHATGFNAYWYEIGKVAEKHGVKVTTNSDAFHRRVRRVLFYDTPSFDLYANAYILRKRTFYVDGWPANEHELTIKFRHKDREVAAAVDIRPRLEAVHRVKFKEELLPLTTHLGGMRSLFSHNCVVVSPNLVLDQGLQDISAVFPALEAIPAQPDTRIDLVNNVAVEEVQVDVGSLNFHHGLEAKATIAIWRDRSSETSLVGEFAFQVKFKRLDALHDAARGLSETFFKAVQVEAPDWILLGTTKTAMVYGLGKARGISHD